jgi:long-chain acyl-CoA synthetase
MIADVTAQDAGYADRPWLAAYPPDVPADHDFPLVPLTQLLDDAARAFPNVVAISSVGNRLTYRALRDAVDRFAGGLAELGVGPKSRVAVILPNCPQHVIAFFGVLRLGGVVVHCNPLATADELRHQLSDSGATVVICLDRIARTVFDVRPDTEVEKIVVTSLADGLSLLDRGRLALPLPSVRAKRARLIATVPDHPALVQFRKVESGGRPAAQAAVDPARDVAVLQYTGGTTGEPKAAMLSHANLVANSYQMRLWLRSPLACSRCSMSMGSRSAC